MRRNVVCLEKLQKFQCCFSNAAEGPGVFDHVVVNDKLENAHSNLMDVIEKV